MVVVYKVDRLIRSLADFAKMVEVFDAREVSFVAVTQQFNTTTSMGCCAAMRFGAHREQTVRNGMKPTLVEASPLTGRLFNEHGDGLTPSHAVKGERRYRYYVSAAVDGARSSKSESRKHRSAN